MISISDLFDLEHTIAADLFTGLQWPWEALAPLADFIRALGEQLPKEHFDHIAPDIWIAKDAKVAKSASLTGPLIIDREADIRHCAHIRGSVVVGKQAVVGTATELKNALLFDGVQVPHYNYVGDSILGYKAHFGAGVITSNVKGDRTLVVICTDEVCYHTKRKKVGAMVGDFSEVGCNAVLNPGTILGRGAQIYPLCSVRGIVPADSIYKAAGNIVPRERKEG